MKVASNAFILHGGIVFRDILNEIRVQFLVVFL